MKIKFMDCYILLNGCIVDEYVLEKGERIDFTCFTSTAVSFVSCAYYDADRVYSPDFDIIDEDKAYFFVKPKEYKITIADQKTFRYGYSQILATLFFDEKYYLSLDSDSTGYNVFRMDDDLQNPSIFTDYYGSVLFVVYSVRNVQTVRAYSLSRCEQIFCHRADRIEVTDFTVYAKTFRKDILSRVVDESYRITDSEVTLAQKNIECKDVHVRTDALVGVLFLESAIVGDKERMKKYLVEDLQDDFDSIFDEFCNATDFTVNSPKDDVFFVTDGGKRKIYEFVYRNGRICDILSA